MCYAKSLFKPLCCYYICECYISIYAAIKKKVSFIMFIFMNEKKIKKRHRKFARKKNNLYFCTRKILNNNN